MPKRSGVYGWKVVDGGSVPYVVKDGVERLLTAHPTPRNHPVRSMLTYTEAGHPLIPLAQIKPFKRVWTDNPILDQGPYGACLPHAFVEAFVQAILLSGGAYKALSPWFLYSLINGGLDQGSTAGDAITALTTIGVCSNDMVPYGTILRTKVNPAAFKDAANHRLREVVQIKTFEEVVNAIFHGWAVTFDICAGDATETDKNGVCGFIPGWTNHEVLATEEYDIVAGQPVVGGRNSWGTNWGVNGRCYWTQRHIENSGETYALRFVAPDPTAALPPSLTTLTT